MCTETKLDVSIKSEEFQHEEQPSLWHSSYRNRPWSQQGFEKRNKSKNKSKNVKEKSIKTLESFFKIKERRIIRKNNSNLIERRKFYVMIHMKSQTKNKKFKFIVELSWHKLKF